jgi:hypothetical protein
MAAPTTGPRAAAAAGRGHQQVTLVASAAASFGNRGTTPCPPCDGAARETRPPARPHLTGIANDEQRDATLGIGDELTVLGWLTPFEDAADQGHPLTCAQLPQAPTRPAG